jgi:uncharacterized protein GlcG (DUF336 family)
MYSQKHLDLINVKEILDAAVAYAGSKNCTVGVSGVKSSQDTEIAQISIDFFI